MRRARLRAVSVGPDRQRHGALAVDETVAAVTEPDMRHAAADDADHHRLDHGQREQGSDGGIDGVAAGGEHLGARGRGQRVIADHHAAAARGRLLLAIENGLGALTPVSGHGFGHPSIAVECIERAGHTAALPASGPVFSRNSQILQSGIVAELGDSDSRDPRPFGGSGRQVLSENAPQRRMRCTSRAYRKSLKILQRNYNAYDRSGHPKGRQRQKHARHRPRAGGHPGRTHRSPDRNRFTGNAVELAGTPPLCRTAGGADLQRRRYRSQAASRWTAAA